MEIVLVRHGLPEKAHNHKLNSAGFARWVKNYNHSLVDEQSRPNKHVFSAFLQDYFVVSSDLPRAIHSTNIALNSAPDLQSKLFREMDIPRYKLPLKLNAWTWVYVNRLLWMLGKSGRFESYAEARKRAKAAADQLVGLATEHQKIIVFSHGYLNLHLRKYLREHGFSQQSKSNQYWGISEFSYDT